MAVGRPIKLTPNVASKTISIIATAGQTSFTPSGGYRVNEVAVYRNGIRLVQGRDFTAIDGATVTLLSAATLDDVVDFQIFDSFNIADALNANGNQTIGGDLTVSGDITGSGTSITGSAIYSSGIVSATSGFNVGIQSSGTAILNTTKTLNFIGAGNTFLDKGSGVIDISISGGGALSNDPIKSYKNSIDSDITLESTHPTAVSWIDQDSSLTLDIEDGVTVTVDDGVYWNIAPPGGT